MRKVYNDIIPFKGFMAMTVFPFIFIRNGCTFNEVDERHETIHGEQQKEMLPIGIALAFILFLFGCGWWSLLALAIYYEWYVAEWLVRIMLMGFSGDWWNTHKAYREISFEQEAYFFQGDPSYPDRRSRYLWFRYLFKRYNKQ